MINIPPFPFRFDGHGINDANGQRLAKVTGLERNIEGRKWNTVFDKVSLLFTYSPEMYKVLTELLEFVNNGTPVHPGAEIWDEVRYLINEIEKER